MFCQTLPLMTEQEVNTVSEAANLADEYIFVHKGQFSSIFAGDLGQCMFSLPVSACLCICSGD